MTKTFGSIEDLLAGKEQEVIDSVRRKGISATMEVYGLRRHCTFLAWLRRISPDSFLFSSSIKDLKGGPKAKWLRDHRDFVLTCIEVFGRDFLIANLPIEPDTLNNFVKFDKGYFLRLRLDRRLGKMNNIDKRDY